MKILVHYVDFSTRWDEWIYVTRDETVYTPKDVARLKRSLMLFQEDCCKKSLFGSPDFNIDYIIGKIENGMSVCECVINNVFTMMLHQH